MAKRSLIFTFAPEPTVVEGFDRRVVESVSAARWQYPFCPTDRPCSRTRGTSYGTEPGCFWKASVGGRSA
ncbi:conserved hypothetical protein [Ricinus communis]|uniref:Uncharacterized protein n=1 Tax=Ricinus communis TaxID=3988 RepID=B9TGD6_RICCO|nr:conserved hypothetical protein [Ricinus communis]